MGLVLDSSVLIVAEREAKPVSRLLAELQQGHGESEILLSSITVVELEHGLHRAQTPEQAQKRRNYLDEVFAATALSRVKQLPERRMLKVGTGTNEHYARLLRAEAPPGC